MMLNEKRIHEKTHENMKRIKNNDYHLEDDTIKKIN